MTITQIVLIFIAVIAITPPLLASIFICAPKWWRQWVEPRLPAVLLTEVSVPTGFGHIMNYVLLLLLSPLTLTAWLIAGWLTACFALIEAKCPYTPAGYNGLSRRRDFNDWLGTTPLIGDWLASLGDDPHDIRR